MGDYQIVILIFTGEVNFFFVLMGFVLDQYLCDRVGKIDLADAALRLGRFKYKRGRTGCLFPCGKGEHYFISSLLTQFLEAVLLNAQKLFFNIKPCVSFTDQFWFNMYAVPGQPQDLTDPHRAAQCEIETQLENWIVTQFQRLLCLLIGEHGPLAFLVFGELNGQNRICTAQIILSERLIECTANKSVDFFNHTGRDQFTFILVTLHLDCRRVSEGIIKYLQAMGGQILDQFTSDEGADVIIDTVQIAG